jgi:hypothetical protein
MLKFVTGNDVAVEVRMSRSAFAGAIVLVEGDDDILFLERFTNTDECILLPARGKDNVLTALRLLDEEEFAGALGIVDADFWHIMPPNEEPENVCLTDYHDIEIMIIESEALVRMLNEYGSQDKIRAFMAQSGSPDIRHALYEIAFPIGVLRLVSMKRGLRLKFDGMRYDRIVSRDTLAVNIEALVNIVLQVSSCHLPGAELQTALDEECLEQIDVDRSQICCGDDLIALICIGLRKALGTQDSKVASRRYIASALRLTYDSEEFHHTGLYACIREWEAYNPAHKIVNI